MDSIFILRLSDPKHASYKIRLQLALLFLNKCVCNPIKASLAERSMVNDDILCLPKVNVSMLNISSN